MLRIFGEVHFLCFMHELFGVSSCNVVVFGLGILSVGAGDDLELAVMDDNGGSGSGEKGDDDDDDVDDNEGNGHNAAGHDDSDAIARAIQASLQ